MSDDEVDRLIDVTGQNGSAGAGLGAYLRHLGGQFLQVTKNRSKAGGRRARQSLIPAAQMTVAGVGAYAVAERLMGHEAPLFAAIAALIALGFTKEPRLRKVLEVAVGCTLGILIGDMLLHLFGTGLLTGVVVLFVSIMLARLLDPGPVFAMQMGLQALLVVLIPPPDGAPFGPFTRSIDAVIGGVVAMLIALLTPKDPRREPIREIRSVVDQLTTALREVATAVRLSDSREAWHALVRSRGIQPQLDQSKAAVNSARELTQFSPAYRRHRHYVRKMARVGDQLDLAVRSLRIVSRRAASMLDHGAISSDGAAKLAKVFDELADASRMLSQAVSEPGPAYAKRMETAQEGLAAVATQLHPSRLDVDTLEGEAVVLLLRTMVLDLLESTGIDHDDAADYLPKL